MAAAVELEPCDDELDDFSDEVEDFSDEVDDSVDVDGLSEDACLDDGFESVR